MKEIAKKYQSFTEDGVKLLLVYVVKYEEIWRLIFGSVLIKADTLKLLFISWLDFIERIGLVWIGDLKNLNLKKKDRVNPLFVVSLIVKFAVWLS